MKYNAGFIGVGNMGSALFDAVARTTSAGSLCVYDMDEQKARKKGVAFEQPNTLVSESKFVFLGVKPNVILKVAEQIKECVTDETVIVSMAAGVDLVTLENALGTERIIRIMPNTPVAVGEGMILYCTANAVTDADISMFLQLMSSAGVVDAIDEKLIDAAAALSGCGPAFVYMFAEALADGAVKCGLPRDKAMKYSKQTILGSGAMMMSVDKHPGQLKDEVCSPGGTTIEGVLALENGGFRYLASSAVTAAFEKTSKLKK